MKNEQQVIEKVVAEAEILNTKIDNVANEIFLLLKSDVTTYAQLSEKIECISRQNRFKPSPLVDMIINSIKNKANSEILSLPVK